jgi:hypothetical protein
MLAFQFSDFLNACIYSIAPPSYCRKEKNAYRCLLSRLEGRPGRPPRQCRGTTIWTCWWCCSCCPSAAAAREWGYEGLETASISGSAWGISEDPGKDTPIAPIAIDDGSRWWRRGSFRSDCRRRQRERRTHGKDGHSEPPRTRKRASGPLGLLEATIWGILMSAKLFGLDSGSAQIFGFFLFFYIFLSSFFQKYMIQKNVKLYIWRRGGGR